MLEEINQKYMMESIQYMTKHFPYRLSGSPCEAEAAEYVSQKMRAFGLEVETETFYTYNSDPIDSKVEVLSPEFMALESLPCAHTRATKQEGECFELVYVRDGSYEAYRGIDVTGKMVLVEVSYAPPVPEKARIACEMGAAGIMCMNWGNDEEVICRRGLKAVWGNPTEESFAKIPDLVGVGITRKAGLRLKSLCQTGAPVHVKVTTNVTRSWSPVHQPRGILRGNGKTGEFLLVCSHLDAWQPGVTCNATGNATALEICRILKNHRQELNRDIYFVFWNGHEVAEAAGSTWFVDHYWDLLTKKCVGYIHIDSTGVRETELFEIKASEELLDFAKQNAETVLPNRALRAMPLKKIGDQSFMGIGIPSITQRMSFTQEYMDRAHGATLGWWNHTIADSLDKCDPDILVEDTKATLQVLYHLATVELLPYEFGEKLSQFREKVKTISCQYNSHMDFSDLLENLEEAETLVAQIQSSKAHYTGGRAHIYNHFVKQVSRFITNITMTYCNKYEQDSYGYTKLSYLIPLFSDFERLKELPPDSLEYGLIQTQLLKNKNRINDGIYQIIESAQAILANNNLGSCN